MRGFIIGTIATAITFAIVAYLLPQIDYGDNIVGLISTANNAPASWVLGDHITDEGSGFLGQLNRAALNSLRFDAAAGSKLELAALGALQLSSGGLLITDNVTAAGAGLFGGDLTAGTSELIVTHDGPQVFEIASSIRTRRTTSRSPRPSTGLRWASWCPRP